MVDANRPGPGFPDPDRDLDCMLAKSRDRSRAQIDCLEPLKCALRTRGRDMHLACSQFIEIQSLQSRRLFDVTQVMINVTSETTDNDNDK